MNKNKLVHFSIISIFVSLYLLVATISMINSVDFFNISHNGILSWSLAIGFELGAAASLAAIIILDKTNKTMVWSLFLLLTAFQMMANSYHAFINLENYIGWIELFGLENEEPIIQKRILSSVSGAVLPLVALGFIKSLTDYIRPNEDSNEDIEQTKEPDKNDNDFTVNDLETIINHNQQNKEPNEYLKNAADEFKDLQITLNDGLNDLEPKNKDITKKEVNNTKVNDNVNKSDVQDENKKSDKNGSQINNTYIDNTTVKAKAQGKNPSSAKDFNRADGMPLKGRQRTGDYI